MTIYDYCNDGIEVNIDRDKIEEIAVDVETGDEIITVIYKDGSAETFDAGRWSGRMLDFHDGSYIVAEDGIDNFLNYVPPEGEFPNCRTASYDRLELFTGIHID